MIGQANSPALLAASLKWNVEPERALEALVASRGRHLVTKLWTSGGFGWVKPLLYSHDS